MATQGEANEKNRRDRRKQARLAKNKKKFDSWVQHKQSQKLKKPSVNLKPRIILNDNVMKDCTKPSPINLVGKDLKRKRSSDKSNFFEFLRMDMEGRSPSAQEDLRFERKLAKKLKVKNGRLRAANDDIDMLLQGIPSVLDNFDKAIADSVSEEIVGAEEDVYEDDESFAEEEGDGYSNVNEGIYDEFSVEQDEEFDSLVSSDGNIDDEFDSLPDISLKDSNRKKTKFEEYLEIDGRNMGEADLAMERKLAKKLKVKAGKVRGGDDDMDMLLDGIPSVLEDERTQSSVEYQKEIPKQKNPKFTKQEQKREENIPAMKKGKFVLPHHGESESLEHEEVRKRVKGLVKRLSKNNVETVSGEILTIYHSVGRIVGSQIISEEVIASCCSGLCGEEQSIGALAAFVTGTACLVGIHFGAEIVERLAKCFEEEYLKEDDASLRNLTMLFSYLYCFGLCSSDLIYDFLIMVGKRLSEVDVSMVVTVLKCCGMRLRGDDPIGMKNFISSVQSRVNELKTSSGDGQSNIISSEMKTMIEIISNIKNNKTKEDTVQHTQIKRWLQKLRVDDILIRGLKWSKLLDPSKKGQWWFPGDVADNFEGNIKEVADTIDKEITETKKMLELAASQRMNTDARKAIFCVIMSADDYVDAFEKILRLDLQGKQDREIMRVLVDCCLQEKIFNKYYCLLASKLCSYDKNHKFTLQYCLWDQLKELESMEVMRSMHLSKFVAEMIASFSLSLGVLKVVDLKDVIHLSLKRIMHFRMVFECILERPDKVVWNIFSRIAVNPEYEGLRSGIEFFIRKYVVGSDKSRASKFKVARKALNNVEGVVM